jgi:hypothetical protein
MYSKYNEYLELSYELVRLDSTLEMKQYRCCYNYNVVARVLFVKTLKQNERPEGAFEAQGRRYPAA